MEENEKLEFDNNFEKIDKKTEHHSAEGHVGGERHGEHHHHHHSGGQSSARYSGGNRFHHDSQQRVVKDRMREVRREKFYKPVLRVFFFVCLIVLIIMLVWAIFRPTPELSDASVQNQNVTENVQSGVKISELEAEVDSLKLRLKEYEKEIADLEEKLAASSQQSGTGGTDNTAE